MGRKGDFGRYLRGLISKRGEAAARHCPDPVVILSEVL